MNSQTMRIIILSGSPRKGSVSLRIARHLVKRFQDITHVTVRLVAMQEDSLPPIQEVWKQAASVPTDKQEIFQAMDQAHGIIVVSPEYNGGYSPALKNFLDHFPKSAYHRKAWGIVTGSTGAMGGMRASQQLQLLGAALSAIICPRMLITPHMDQKFDEAGELLDQSFDRQIEDFLANYLWLLTRLTAEVGETGSQD